MQESKQWKAATKTQRSNVRNPIRAVLESEFKIPSQPPKKMINLSLGQAQKDQGYVIADLLKQKVIDAINSDKANGYVASTGMLEARKAVSTFLSSPHNPQIDPNNVILTAGTSGALYTAIASLCQVGTNILLPQPGFPLCIPICQNLGVSYKFYNLLPENQWQIDLAHLESLIDSQTTAIVVNNPSNPCGSVFSAQHMLQILRVADKNKLPLIADEVYYGMVYDKQTQFIAFADLNAKDHLKDQEIKVPQVPIISNGAISKMYSVPGWRLGWTVFYNRHNVFDQTIKAAQRMSQIWLHPQVPIQYALPEILGKVGSDYFDQFLGKIRKSAEFIPPMIQKQCGRFLKAVKTKGAMYMMIKINLEQLDSKQIKDDVDFSQKLVNEQGVLMLPGKCFNAIGFVRIVLCHGLDMFTQTIQRLKEFCETHARKSK